MVVWGSSLISNLSPRIKRNGLKGKHNCWYWWGTSNGIASELKLGFIRNSYVYTYMLVLSLSLASKKPESMSNWLVFRDFYLIISSTVRLLAFNIIQTSFRFQISNLTSSSWVSTLIGLFLIKGCIGIFKVLVIVLNLMPKSVPAWF
jgi:hypothetical protein